MAEKKDITNIVEIVKLVGAMSSAYDGAKADGKVDINDLVQLLPVIPYVEPAIKDAGQVIPELEDLSAPELDLLMAELAKVSIIGSKIEVLNKVRASLEAVRALYNVYVAFANKVV